MKTEKIFPTQILHKFNMEYGTFVGLAWAAAFYAYVYGFRMNNSMLSLLAMLGFLANIVLPFYFGIRLRRVAMEMSFKGSVFYWISVTVSMFMYACLICGAAEFIYFKMLDHGSLYEALSNAIKEANLKGIYREAGMLDQYNQIIDGLNALRDLSAVEIALMMSNMNFTLGLVLSVPVMLFTSLKNLTKK